MKRIFVLAVILIGAVCSASAQYYYGANNNNNNGPVAKFGFGITSGFGVGPVSNAYPEAGGLSLKLELPVSKSPLSVVFSTGYTFYASDGGYGLDVGTDGYGGSSYYDGSIASFIPVEAGLKLYVAPHLFLEAEAGVSFNVNTYAEDYTGKTTDFIYTPAIGYTLPFGFSRKQALDVTLFYENRPETGGGYSQIGLGALWNFGLK
jgi:hypothetical protein